jgi:hypothetical protein
VGIDINNDKFLKPLKGYFHLNRLKIVREIVYRYNKTV